MGITEIVSPIFIITDTHNIDTTAGTTILPEQQDTIRTIHLFTDRHMLKNNAGCCSQLSGVRLRRHTHEGMC